MNFAIVAAGGNGVRMQMSGLPKQFVKINKKPLICFCLEQLEKSKKINTIVVSCNKSFKNYTATLVKKSKKHMAIVDGGTTRVASLVNALKYIESNYKISEKDYVLITDAARPLITNASINKVFSFAKTFGSAACVSAVPGTIMICENNQIIKTQQRCRTKIGQAPQVYKLKELLQYIHKSEAENVNFDDFEDFFLYYGKTIYAYECVDDSNLKVTTQDDLAVLKNKIFKK